MKKFFNLVLVVGCFSFGEAQTGNFSYTSVQQIISPKSKTDTITYSLSSSEISAESLSNYFASFGSNQETSNKPFIQSNSLAAYSKSVFSALPSYDNLSSLAISRAVSAEDHELDRFLLSNFKETTDGEIMLPAFQSLNYSGLRSASSISTFSTIKYMGFTDRNEEVYSGKNEISSFEFYNHELINYSGQTLPLATTISSSTISPEMSASEGNGAYHIQRAIFRDDWIGTDNSPWASLLAPNNSQGASFTLYPYANLGNSNAVGSFVIGLANGNSFRLSSNRSESFIGFTNPEETKIIFSAAVIQTDALLRVNNSIQVYDGLIDKPNSSDDVLGYFASSKDGSTGLTVANFSTSSIATSGITFTQRSYSNWIGTWSEQSSSNFYSSGALVIQSNGLGGILFNSAADLDGQLAPIRFGSNMREIARLTQNSFLIGTELEDPSSILTVKSESKGVLFSRMSSFQRSHIKNPTKGLTVFDTTLNKYCFYNGKKWEEIISQIINE